nr:acyl-CoA dehydrogenase family protein [Bradyrhizobium campsiandrae]
MTAWLVPLHSAPTIEFARQRTAFGKPLGEHARASFMLADNAIDIHQAQLTIWRTAWLLDRGERASTESSMAKVTCSEAVPASLTARCRSSADSERHVIRSLSDSTAMSAPFASMTPLSELHRWAIRRRLLTYGGR